MQRDDAILVQTLSEGLCPKQDFPVLMPGLCRTAGLSQEKTVTEFFRSSP